MTPRGILSSGMALCGLAVVFGAFAAHGLQLEGKPQAWWQTAVEYQMYHGLALLACGLLATHRGRRGSVAAWSFLLGTLLFSGSLYAMALGAPRWFGAITPIGGSLFLVGWVAMLWLARAASTTSTTDANAA